jgi:hypothetical protein
VSATESPSPRHEFTQSPAALYRPCPDKRGAANSFPLVKPRSHDGVPIDRPSDRGRLSGLFVSCKIVHSREEGGPGCSSLKIFGFLGDHDPDLEAERYFRDDPPTTLIILRQFAALLSKLIAARNAVYVGERETFEDTLRRLSYPSCLKLHCAHEFHSKCATSVTLAFGILNLYLAFVLTTRPVFVQ